MTNGNFCPVEITGTYKGAKLKPNSMEAGTTDATFGRNFDFTPFSNPSGVGDPDNNAVLTGLQRAAGDKYLEDLNFDDGEWLGRQPIVEPPSIDFAEGSKGTSSDPFIIECGGFVQEAWGFKLRSSDPQAMRRRRSRRLQSQPMPATIADKAVRAVLKNNILQSTSTIRINVTPGGISGEDTDVDIFKEAKALIGVDGAGAFMNPGARRLSSVSLSDYTLNLALMSAEPLCDSFRWTFDIYIENASGKKSETIAIHAVLNYGIPQFQVSTLDYIQTVCDTDDIGVEDLEENMPLQFYYGVEGSGLSPKLSSDNCPSPYVSLTSEDTTVQSGIRCTQTYKTITRNWSFNSAENCPSPDVGVLPTQTIVAGDLVIPSIGEPITPQYELQGKTYYLPNERDATVPTSVTDFYKGGPPVDACGICSIVYSNPEDFDCSEVGDNTIDVTILNSIGISAKKSAVARVIDDKPPNMITQNHTVFLNRFGWLDEINVVTVPDIDDGSWDNCEIADIAVSPTHYQCNDEGPQTVTLSAIDPSDNPNSMDQTVIVDDSARLGINGDEQVIMPSLTDNLIDHKMREDFNFEKCEEIAVYVRPEGESNFAAYEGFIGGRNEKWKIPKFYNKADEQSVLFWEAFCGGVLPEDVPEGNLCVGEAKAEVLCEKGCKEGKGDKVLHQTCYRAQLEFDPLYNYNGEGWYVDWSSEHCRQDCATGPDASASCGGPAENWGTLFSDAATCCNNIATHKNADWCEETSLGNSYPGSGKFYVDPTSR